MNLKQIRQMRKMSIPQLSELTGIHYRTLQDVERRNDCRVSTAIKLADALGVTLDALCRDDHPTG